MSKITDITIIDSHTIKLNNDAKAGDIIDLLDINNIDMSIITKKIEEQKDIEYNRRLDSLKREAELTQAKKISEAVEKALFENTQLKRELELKEKTLKIEIEAQFQIEKNNLLHQIETFKNEVKNIELSKRNEIDLAIKKKELELKDKINELNNQIKELKQDKDTAIKDIEHQTELKIAELENTNKAIEEKTKSDLQLAMAQKDKEFREAIQNQQETINKLKLEKSNLNVKRMGEELEKWVDQEYQIDALNGFDNCEWQKDNQVVKNTKADYIYRVFATNEKKQNELLTSVAIEVKSENPETINKRKNTEFYQKLHEDRENKQCEYALLVSELEWDVVNDAPIRKVPDYDKMYMVRPQYFMVFIHIVTALGMKFKDGLLDKNRIDEAFRDTKEILADFEGMKNDILDKSIRYILDRVNDIEDSASKIIQEGRKVLDSAKVIKETHLQTVINKITSFKINKITRNIKDLEDKS